jgi:two-component system, chemotaxis family, CheB/CheR fusion protein
MKPADTATSAPDAKVAADSQFTMLLQAMPVAAFTCDAHGTITSYNAAMRELWNRPPDPESPSDRWFGPLQLRSIGPETAVPREESWLRTVIRTGDRSREEYIVIRQDGARLTISAEAYPLRDDEGQVQGAVAVLNDVTGRRHAEITEARLGAIIASSDDAIISKTLDGTILSWNAGAERLFGYRPEEAIGRSVTIIIPHERHDEEREILAKLIRGERVDHYETIRCTKSGELIDVSLTSSPVRDASGRIVGASKIARDITARKRHEEQRLLMAEELRRADQAKNDFLATLAHELRNPLAPIRNLVYVLERSAAPLKELPGALGIMNRQLTQMARLIDDLMDISRISKNKFQLHRERMDLRMAVETAIESSQPLLAERAHRFSAALPEQPLLVDGDLTRLTQAIGNVLNNAARYTGRGGTIALAVQQVGANAVVTVADNGAGIAEPMLDRIFEMFVQGDSSADRGNGGLGLGLHLARRLMEMQGGTLSATSDGIGRGSVFSFSIPVAIESGPTDRAGDIGGTTGVPDRRILVVDDNRDAADSLSLCLELLGYTVCSRYDGAAALAEGANFRPHIVVLDIGLPGMDGYEVARRIRAEPWGDGILLCALTGWGHDDVRRETKRAGFDAHFVKPVDVSALARAIEANAPRWHERR